MYRSHCTYMSCNIHVNRYALFWLCLLCLLSCRRAIFEQQHCLKQLSSTMIGVQDLQAVKGNVMSISAVMIVQMLKLLLSRSV